MRERRYNARTGETNANSYQITFRANRRVSGRFASCMGLVEAYGQKQTMIQIFEAVLLPALEEYVAPLAEKAKHARRSK